MNECYEPRGKKEKKEKKISISDAFSLAGNISLEALKARNDAKIKAMVAAEAEAEAKAEADDETHRKGK